MVIEKALCGFRSFKLIEDKSPQIGLFFLANDHAFIEKEFFTQDFIQYAGQNRIDGFDKDTSFGYTIIGNENDDNTSVESYLSTATMLADAINDLFSCLWFIKDCSSHLYETILYSKQPSQCVILPNHEIYTCSQGEYVTETFSMAQINEAYQYLYKYRSHSKDYNQLLSVGGIDFNTLKKRPNINYSNRKSRIGRSLSFLNIARKENFIPMKISLYVAAFECLFATEEKGFSRNVPIRVTGYLCGENPNNKEIERMREYYDALGFAYGIRSKFIHAGKIFNDEKIEIQKPISKKVDQLLRLTLRKAIEENLSTFDLPKDQLREWHETLHHKYYVKKTVPR